MHLFVQLLEWLDLQLLWQGRVGILCKASHCRKGFPDLSPGTVTETLHV